MSNKAKRQQKIKQKQYRIKSILQFLKTKQRQGKRIDGDNPGGMQRLDRKVRGELRISNKSNKYLRQDLTETGDKAIRGVSRKVIIAKIMNKHKATQPYRHLNYEWA